MRANEQAVVVVGSATAEVRASAPQAPAAGQRLPGTIRLSAGGVARNIAENLARLEVPTTLLSAVGDDLLGDLILGLTARTGVEVGPVVRVRAQASNSALTLLTPSGELAGAVEAMGALAALTPSVLMAHRALIQGARVVVFDNTLPDETLALLVALCREAGVSLCADPTQPFRAARLRPYLPQINLITPNQPEAAALCDCTIETIDDALDAARQLVREGVRMALITMGAQGVVYATSSLRGHIAARPTELVNRTGGSDALTATAVYGLINDFPPEEAVRLGVTAASLTISSPDSVRPDLSLELLYDSMVA